MRQALQSLTVFGASPAPAFHFLVREFGLASSSCLFRYVPREHVCRGRSPLAAARMRESAASLMDAAIATVATAGAAGEAAPPYERMAATPPILCGDEKHIRWTLGRESPR